MDPAAYEVVHDLEESHWFFVAKRRILSRLLDEMLDGTRNPRILDVGCGTGATMGFLERYGEVTGVESRPRPCNMVGNRAGRACAWLMGCTCPSSRAASIWSPLSTC